VGSWGVGREALAKALGEGRVVTSEVERPEGFHLPGGARRAALVNPELLKPWLDPRKARRMSPPSKFTVAAATMAWREAGLEGADGSRTAVVVSTSFGPSSYTERLLQQIFFEGPEAASPMLFAESVANAPAAQAALAFKAYGANITVTQREAGPLIALARGVAEIRQGRADRVIVAAVDEVSTVLHAALDRFGALCRATGEGEEDPRPFDARRDGFLLAEGAGALVLESETTARQRGAKPLARVSHLASAFDPEAPRSTWGRDPGSLAEALERYLAEAGIAPESVEGIVSCANGSLAGDRLEALILRSVWGETTLPPVLAPKAVTGEYGGGLLVPAVVALTGEAQKHPAVHSEEEPDFEVDPELGIRPVASGETSSLQRILVSSLAAGGAAAWAVLEQPS